MGSISLKAAVISVVIVLALDIAGGVVLLAIFGRHFFRDGMSSDQINQAVMAITGSTEFLVGALIVGTATTIIGGYISARVSKTNAYLNAGIVGLLGLVLGILLSHESPVWFNVVAIVTVIPAALVGGHMGKGRSTVTA